MQRRRKQRQEVHLVADIVQTALVAKQRETEQVAAATRTQRRKRAPRKHKRNSQDGHRSADVSGAPSALGAGASSSRFDNSHNAFHVTIENLLVADELEDSDEFADNVADLEHDLQTFGQFLSLHITRATGDVAVAFADEASARAAVDAKHNKRFGGRTVTARFESVVTTAATSDARPQGSATALAVLSPPSAAAATEQMVETTAQSSKKTKKKKRTSKCKSAVLRARDALQRDSAAGASDAALSLSRRLLVRNLLAPDDVADPDERDDLLDELRSDFVVFGSLTALEIWTSAGSRAGGEDDEKTHVADSQAPALRDGDVLVEFSDLASARAAFAAYDSRVFGNRSVECFWQTQAAESAVSGQSVRVTGMLDAAELMDDDEFDDTHDDVRELLTRFGALATLAIDRSSGAITVQFGAADAAARAVAKLDKSMYGGRSVAASLLVSEAAKDDGKSPAPARAVKSVRDRAPAAAERQREPLQPMAPEVVDAVTQLLRRLASLQERAHHRDPVYDKRSRRLVLGLHEVRRGLATKKIQLLLIATDVEVCDVLDDRVAEILAIARREGVPVAFPMNRRKLGRALGKSVRVSCVGVYSYEGANNLFATIAHSCKTTTSITATASSG